MKTLHRIAIFIFAAALIFGCAGCSDKKPEERKDHSKSGRVATIKTHLQHMQDNILQLERDQELTRRRIDAVKADFAVLKEALGIIQSGQMETSASVAVIEKDSVRGETRKNAENRTLATLFLLCFVLFVGVYGYVIWRKKTSPEAGEELPAGEAHATVHKDVPLGVDAGAESEKEPLKPSNDEPPAGK